MKMKTITSALAAIGLVMNISAQTVFTSNFETWNDTIPTDWFGTQTNIKRDSVQKDSVAVYQGKYACKIINTTTNHRRLSTKQTFSIKQGKSYIFSYSAKGTGSVRAGMYTGKGSTFGYSYAAYNTVNSTKWYRFSQSILADTTTTLAQFLFSVKTNNPKTPAMKVGDLYIDSVTVEEADIQDASIYQIQFSTGLGDSPFKGKIVNTGGIVTAAYPKNFYMQSSNSKAWSGILVYDFTYADSVSIGDSITFSASVTEYYNMTELSGVKNFVKVSSNNPVPAPVVLKTKDVSKEMYEGILVTVKDATCKSYDAKFKSWIVNDGSGNVTVDDDIFAATPIVNNKYTVTGPVNYAFSAYTIEPRDVLDVIGILAGIDEYSANGNQYSVYPNPTNGTFTIKNLEIGINNYNVKIYNFLGEVVFNQQISKSTNQQIDLSNQPNGIYLMQIITDDKMENVKIIKE